MNAVGVALDEIYGGLGSLIHVAGDPVGHGQMCVDCGAVLIDETDEDGSLLPRSVAIPPDDPEPRPPTIKTGTLEHPEREITGNEPEMVAFFQAHDEWRARMDALAAPAFWPAGALVYEVHRWGVPTTFPRMTGLRQSPEELPLDESERFCG